MSNKVVASSPAENNISPAKKALAPGGWHPQVDGSVRLYRQNATELYLLITEKANVKNGFRWIARQADIAKMFRVSVRTLQRWIAQLREDGRLITEYVHNSRGHRTKTVFALPLFHERTRRQDSAYTTPGVVTGSKSKTNPTTSSLRSDVDPQSKPENAQSRSTKSRNHSRKLNPYAPGNSKTCAHKIDENGGSMAGSVDIKVGSDQTGSTDVDRTKGANGTPTQRVIGWWLGNRAERPLPAEVFVMGRAIKRCLEHRTEEQVARELYELMLSGNDKPVHLERRVGFVRKNISPYAKRYLTPSRSRRSMLKSGVGFTWSTSTPASSQKSAPSSTDGWTNTPFDREIIEAPASVNPNAGGLAADLLALFSSKVVKTAAVAA